ncbi:MAG: FAD-dependent oxidoreductase [Desulfobacteraceae bacterium]|jgi:NADPH-dependent glutamate synthase beta subunit-like oxidoreductase|nr:FAD-dependent oxidoreductase [Desulfobacteraceae bacterium]
MKYSTIDKQLPLFIPHSSITTAVNKTGSWRFFHPKYEEKTAPCSAACPVGQDIPRIEMLTSRGQVKDAWQKILNENPFPAICGRVCFHPCESACNRAGMDDPIAIHHLERFLGDAAITGAITADRDIRPSTGKKVAVAGAGPAGLAAAYFLTRLGYECDVFEAAAKPGGLLRWGIPAYRLPRDILDHEIKRIEKAGVHIHCETPVNERLLENLKKDYDGLFLGCGYARSFMLNIEGEEFASDGLEFLNRLAVGEKISYFGNTAIIGGGNAAVDVARSLARLGAAPLIVYRRRIQDMPAFEPEVAMAAEEGVRIMELVTPIRIRETAGDSSSAVPGYELTLQKMKVSKKEIRGRARVIPDGDATQTLTVQNIFVAIGAVAEDLWQFPGSEETSSLILSHCRFFDQKIPQIYGGDLTSPIKSVTDAIASGKQAALALDTYFKHGMEAIEERLAGCGVGGGPALSMDIYLEKDRKNRTAHIVGYDEIVTDYFQPATRSVPPTLDAGRRVRSFREIAATLDRSTARQEAERCFNCGICTACDYCRLYCPEMAVIVENARRSINMDFCKGCGVCATECPRNAMALEEEIK